VSELQDAVRDLEADVRERQAKTRSIDGRRKREERTDLMPGRHYAIALTALEEARLRIGEAERVAALGDDEE
jgi:hypothetical protein